MDQTGIRGTVETNERPAGWGLVEVQQLDLEAGLGPLEHQGEVVGAHGAHAHVARRLTAIDPGDVAEPEPEQREEGDGGVGVGDGQGHVVSVADHQVQPRAA